VARRILAAALAGLAIVMVFPGRLPGAPSTTSTSEPSFEDLLGVDQVPHPDPLRLYPDRPGARYEDVEARVGHAVALGFDRLRVAEWSRTPHATLPDRAEPARLAPYRAIRLVDGYVPVVTDTNDDLLQLRVTRRKIAIDSTMHCVATRAADGAVLVPFDLPNAPRSMHPSTTTTTVAKTGKVPLVSVTLLLPLGPYHGRLYVTCTQPLFNEARAVWAIDV
jgi:hypothetical protein